MNLSPRAQFWLAAIGGTIIIAFLAIIMTNDKAKAADKNGPAASNNVFADAPVATNRSWSGCYIRGDAGLVAMDTKAGLETAPPAPVSIISVDGLGAKGEMIAGQIGCDVQMGKSPFVIGMFADYSKFYNADWSLHVLPATANVAFGTGLDNQWSVGVRGGVLATPKTLVYALISYSRLEMASFSGSVAGVALPGALSFQSFNGLEVGGGVETMLGGGWRLTAESRWGIYDAQSMPIAPGAPVNLRVEPNTLTARVGLGYAFNFGQ